MPQRCRPQPEGTTRVTVLAGQTFRGVKHFEDTDYDVSSGWYDYLLEQGVAVDASHKDAPANKPARTLKQVNAAIAAAGHDATLVKGKGYLYFVGPAVDGAYSTSVMVNAVSHLTVNEWLDELAIVMDHARG